MRPRCTVFTLSCKNCTVSRTGNKFNRNYISLDIIYLSLLSRASMLKLPCTCYVENANTCSSSINASEMAKTPGCLILAKLIAYLFANRMSSSRYPFGSDFFSNANIVAAVFVFCLCPWYILHILSHPIFDIGYPWRV